MARLFITGGTGYLSSALLRRAAEAGHLICASYFSQSPPVAPNTIWTPLDIREPIAVEEAMEHFQPEVVIHTAFRQFGPDVWAITAEGSGNVARAAASLGARLIHMSSDVIFDGEGERPYNEQDPPNPISDYGSAKAAAEQMVTATDPTAAIVRTSLIYGFEPIDRQTQFALEVAAGQRNDRLFSDEYRCPVFVEDLAAALLELAESDYAGILNVAGAERLSRYEFGTLMVRACGADPALIGAALSAESGMRRPRNCTLDIGRAQAILKTQLRGVREVLRDLGRLA